MRFAIFAESCRQLRGPLGFTAFEHARKRVPLPIGFRKHDGWTLLSFIMHAKDSGQMYLGATKFHSAGRDIPSYS